MSEDIFTRVQKVVAEKKDLSVADVTPTSNLIEDLGADSLDIVDIIMGLEEEFDIEIPDDAAQDIKTVQDICDYIEKKI